MPARTRMHFFKKTIVAAHKLRAQAANLRRCLRADLFLHIIDPLAKRSVPQGRSTSSSPGWFVRIRRLVQVRAKRPSATLNFVSYASDDGLKGSHRYCGGEKLLNNLVLLLRRHGYEAYMVSLDGPHAGLAGGACAISLSP